MNLHNQTSMQFICTDNALITRVKYDLTQGLEILPLETYRCDLTEEIKLDTYSHLHINGIQEEIIRSIEIEVNRIKYKADNVKSFWQFVKSNLSWTTTPSKSSAIFRLPIVNHTDQIKTNLNHSIQLKPLPWIVKSRQEFRERVIEPKFHQLELDYPAQTLTAILVYSHYSTDSLLIQQGGLS